MDMKKREKLNNKRMEREREIGEGRSSSSLREQRNLREKHRRMRMKDLYSKLSSHVSPTHTVRVPRLIDQATSYMLQLREKVDYLTEKKKTLMLIKGQVHKHSKESMSLVPKLSFRSRDSTIEMNLIIMHRNMKKVMLHELLSVFEEEGAQVVSAHLQNLDDHKTTCTIIAKAMICRIGIDTSRIEERVKDIIS